MNKKDSENKVFLKFRKKAEEKLKLQVEKLNKGVDSEIRHELEVYKFELEMQNEELLITQSKLLKSIDEFTNLFEFAPVAYFILDKNGLITNANQTGIQQLGVDKKQLIGNHLSVFICSKEDQDDYYRHRKAVIEKESSQQMECQIIRKDGSFFYAQIDSAIVKDEKNKFKHFLSAIIDISEQKEQKRRLEMSLLKEKELNEMKSQFISIASHEFRTPLSTILTSAELIERYSKPADEYRREAHFRKIKTSVSRLREILIDFLSADEFEKGNIRNNPESFNIVKFSENLIEELKTFDGIHKLKYSHSGKSNTVFLDKKLLKTCLTNLIINALKFSPDGGAIEITSELANSKGLIISIKDEGLGIPKKDQEHIFESFFRAKNVESIQGTGLGLNITQKLVNFMAGTISFVSKENEGSTFTVKF
jgi:PAS domain S-box-containing protein